MVSSTARAGTGPSRRRRRELGQPVERAVDPLLEVRHPRRQRALGRRGPERVADPRRVGHDPVLRVEEGGDPAPLRLLDEVQHQPRPIERRRHDVAVQGAPDERRARRDRGDQIVAARVGRQASRAAQARLQRVRELVVPVQRSRLHQHRLHLVLADDRRHLLGDRVDRTEQRLRPLDQQGGSSARERSAVAEPLDPARDLLARSPAGARGTRDPAPRRYPPRRRRRANAPSNPRRGR